MMRAKLTIVSVTLQQGSELLEFCPDYSASKEDQTYSAATPTASLKMQVCNPDLLGKFKPGQKFYVDFTAVDTAAPEGK